MSLSLLLTEAHRAKWAILGRLRDGGSARAGGEVRTEIEETLDMAEAVKYRFYLEHNTCILWSLINLYGQ